MPEEPYDLPARASQLDVRLSPKEMSTLVEHADTHYGDGDGVVTRSEFVALVRDFRDEDAEKEALVSFIVKKDENSPGQRTLLGLDYMATGLFATVGTIIAGQAGMNVVGATLVGCVASMGGGSLNNMLTGSATRGGVFWMKDSLILAIAIGASLATFYLWPMYEERTANQFCSELHSAIGVAIEERVGDGARGVSYEQFCAALDGDPQVVMPLPLPTATSPPLHPLTPSARRSTATRSWRGGSWRRARRTSSARWASRCSSRPKARATSSSGSPAWSQWLSWLHAPSSSGPTEGPLPSSQRPSKS